MLENVFRLLESLIRRIEKLRIKVYLHCPHNDFKIVGHIHIINRDVIIGHKVVLYPGVMFWGDGPIVIGDNVSIGNQTVIYSSKKGGVTIGDNTQIAAQCYIIDMDHGTRADKIISNQPNSVAKVIIGNDCWLGANVTVLKGSTIQDGAIIGAKSLVKGHVNKNVIAMGIPVIEKKNRSRYVD